MSVTGHGAKTGHVRHPDDAYFTPAWCTRAILPHLDVTPWTQVLDPCCGDGAILDVVEDAHPTGRRCGIEIDAGRATTAGKRHRVICGDALMMDVQGQADLILTNPPFKLAMEFVQRALVEVRAGGTVAMLLRLPWLASQKRAPWLRKNTPSVYVLPKRPSFTGKGTDATDYFWAVWNGLPPTVCILEVEPVQ